MGASRVSKRRREWQRRWWAGWQETAQQNGSRRHRGGIVDGAAASAAPVVGWVAGENVLTPDPPHTLASFRYVTVVSFIQDVGIP